MIPGALLGARALFDFEILCWQNFWLPFTVFTLFLSLFLVFSEKEFQKQYTPLLIIPFCAFYGFGPTICLNCIMDKSKPEKFYAEIINKKIEDIYDGPSVYYLTLSPWGPRKTVHKVHVPMEIYYSSEINNKIEVCSKKGAFKIPWFYVKNFK